MTSYQARGAARVEPLGVPGHGVAQSERVAVALIQYYPRTWRTARRMGLDGTVAEEVTQEAFIVLHQRINDVQIGAELSFLLATVTRLASNARRLAHHRFEQPSVPEVLDGHESMATSEQLMEQKRAKDLVDEVLALISEPMRVVFILYELEQMTLQEIANALEIPLGTAGSRLRKARDEFHRHLNRLMKCRGLSPEDL
ncbi:MAG: RNA polymerase sigma factor [Myxococcales bacterium]